MKYLPNRLFYQKTNAQYSVMKMHNMTSQVFRETTGAVISDGCTDKHTDMQTDNVILWVVASRLKT